MAFRAKLAIAGPSFGASSTTFIRQHARDLAPRLTVLLCNDAAGTEQFNCPVLFDMEF